MNIYFGLHFNFQRVETDYTHSKVNSENVLGIPYNQFSFLTFFKTLKNAIQTLLWSILIAVPQGLEKQVLFEIINLLF